MKVAGRNEESAHPRTDAEWPSDGSLFRRIRDGNNAAAEGFYNRYARRLHAVVRATLTSGLGTRVDTDDVVQSVFRRFFEAAREGVYEVPTGETFWKLLLVITLNRIRSLETHHRAARRDIRRTSHPIDLERQNGKRSGQETEAESILRMTISELLVEMPARYRRVVEMRLKGHSVAEIARVCGRSKRTVERILQEAIAKFAKNLDETVE